MHALSRPLLIIGAAACAVVLLTALSLKVKGTGVEPLLAERVSLVLFTREGAQTGRGAFQVEFTADETDPVFVNGAIDINRNETFDEGEWVLKNIATYPAKNEKQNFFFTVGLPLQGEKKLHIAASDFPLVAENWKGVLPTGRVALSRMLSPRLYEINDIAFTRPTLTAATGTEVDVLPVLEEALKRGAKPELELVFSEEAGARVGAHTITPRRVVRGAGDTFLAFYDEVLSEGLSVYRATTELRHYAAFEGATLLGQIFLQGITAGPETVDSESGSEED